MGLIKRLWGKIREPRVISMLMWLQYLSFLAGGIAALVEPPHLVLLELGPWTMSVLAGLLIFGGTVGAISALPGIWWLERFAVVSITFAGVVYGGVVTFIEITIPESSRVLQLSFIAAVMLLQGVRWHRIWERPYDPARTD